MVQEERVRALNDRSFVAGRYVLYWMQASQRTEHNHALEYAAHTANELNKPLIVFFGITENYPEANWRHYHFMLQGIRETQARLAERGIGMIVRRQSPDAGAVELADQAAAVVVDCGHTRTQRNWRRSVAERLECPLIQVEADVVVPAQTASHKEAYAAADFRRNIEKHLDDYLAPLQPVEVRTRSTAVDLETMELSDLSGIADILNVDGSVRSVDAYEGGTSNAIKLLDGFLTNKLHDYAEKRNDPSLDYQSGMSPYLHFGQISPLYVALVVREAGGPGAKAYLDELIVRRELAINYVYYNEVYDSYASVPEWARKTLEQHRQDFKEQLYTLEQLERAETYDRYWNAAQWEMTNTGKMHGYMRMYWGKRIIEWTESPEQAFRVALYLNNKYELDGRDANSYAGVAWCFGKHDRPWPERPIFGKVRTMSENGLKRKFDVDAYVKRVNQMSARNQ